jgi:hypothetical protein
MLAMLGCAQHNDRVAQRATADVPAVQTANCARDNAGFAQKQFVLPRLFSTMPP